MLNATPSTSTIENRESRMKPRRLHGGGGCIRGLHSGRRFQTSITSENPISRRRKTHKQDCGKPTNKIVENPQTRLRKTHKQDCGKPTNKIAEKQQSRLRETCNPDRTKRAIQTEQNVHSGLHKTCNPDRTKRADFTTTVVDTNNINVIDHTNNVISCNRDYVDYVSLTSSFLQKIVCKI
jgi:hypothetical protein